MSPVDDRELRRLAFAAGRGDSTALERVVSCLRDQVYGLALRMLWQPDDAEDATQEALVADRRGGPRARAITRP